MLISYMFLQEVGDWKNYLNDEQNNRLEQRITEWQSARPEPVPLTFEI